MNSKTQKQFIESKLNELTEPLANIEHQRWAKWQAWVHNRLRYTEIKGVDGNNYAYYLMTSDDYERWDRQINTYYADLSEAEKESDRREVRSYLPLISTALKEIVEEYKKETDISDELFEIINNWYDKDNNDNAENLKDKILDQITSRHKEWGE